MLPSINPTTTESWKLLEKHFEEIKNRQMQHVFEEDPDRAQNFSLEWQEFLVDCSKNRMTDKTRKLLLALAEEVQLKEAISKQFEGGIINETEKRAVLHTALRDFENMKPEVKTTLQ